MHRGLTEPRYGREVLGGRIAFVTVKPVSRVVSVQLPHLTVTGDLGNNRRRRDGGAPSIPADDTTLRKEQIGNPETVDQDEIRQRNQAVDGSPHRFQ